MEEMRKYRRLTLRMPLECRFEGSASTWRSFSRDISTGGVYFEIETACEHDALGAGQRVLLDITLPPGEGYSPYPGHLMGSARILRHQQLSIDRLGVSRIRHGIAAGFDRPIKLVF